MHFEDTRPADRSLRFTATGGLKDSIEGGNEVVQPARASHKDGETDENPAVARVRAELR